MFTFMYISCCIICQHKTRVYSSSGYRFPKEIRTVRFKGATREHPKVVNSRLLTTNSPLLPGVTQQAVKYLKLEYPCPAESKPQHCYPSGPTSGEWSLLSDTGSRFENLLTVSLLRMAARFIEKRKRVLGYPRFNRLSRRF